MPLSDSTPTPISMSSSAHDMGYFIHALLAEGAPEFHSITERRYSLKWRFINASAYMEFPAQGDAGITKRDVPMFPLGWHDERIFHSDILTEITTTCL